MENTTPTLVVERKEYEAVLTEVAELRMLVEYYKQQLLLSKRRQFGSSSEQSDVEGVQLDLFGNAVAAPPPEVEQIPCRRKKRAGKREEDLSGLPVERIDYELPEAQRVCPSVAG